MWDVIVIGSGISGLSCAAALAQAGRRVLVLEQHSVAGGLTQTFRRQDWTFAAGVHYIGSAGSESGPGGHFARLMHGLSDGALAFADCGNPYDIVRLPGFEFGIEHPESAYRAALAARFPGQQADIDRWFGEMAEARRAALSLLAARGLPSWLAWGLRLWRGRAMHHFVERTLADALAEVADPQLRAVLGARWGDHGAAPPSAPLLEHALVTGAYNFGAYYPVGGPGRFAEALVPVIERAGGALRLGADVVGIAVEQGQARSVSFDQLGQRQTEMAAHIVSTMGVGNTLACLPSGLAPDWDQAARSLEPGLSYLALYLGFEGDIAAAGASRANLWIYESTDIGRVWQAPADEDAPGIFVSFPSLKDPGYRGRPTAEVIAFCPAQTFEPWLDLPAGERPEAYLALKDWVAQRLLAQFARHFPALMPMLRFHEMSTPVTQRHFVRTPAGATYGLAMDAQRLESPALTVRTPVPGLMLAGQDVSGPGVQAASLSGMMAAAAIEPAVWRRMGG